MRPDPVTGRSPKWALESVGRIRLSRASHMEIKSPLAPMVAPRGRALEFFRLVAKETDNSFAESLAGGRELSCEALRILFAPDAP